MISARASRNEASELFESAEALLLANQPEKATSLLNGMIDASPQNARALHLKALAAASQRLLPDAILLLQRALSLQPEAAWFRDLGMLQYITGNRHDACRSFARAWKLAGPDRELRNYFARALMDTKHPMRALSLFKEPCPAAVSDAKSLLIHAEALIRNRRWAAPVPLLERACQLDPSSYVSHDLCAIACACSAYYDEAVRHRRAALLLTEDPATARQALATALFSTGEMDECLALGQELLQGAPRTADFHFSHLVAIDHSTHSAAGSLEAWRNFAKVHCISPGAPLPKSSDLDPHRPLRIGYLVDQIHKLPDRHFIPPLLAARNQKDFVTFCYLTSARQQNYHVRLQSLVNITRDLRHAAIQQIAQQIRSDQVDILVNVSWDARHRHLQVFSHRPAPIQIELPHYPASTGVPQTGHIFTDQWVCPPGSEGMYTERVYRLPMSYLPWVPPAKTPPVSTLPAARNNFCTFGFFQKPAKLNPAVWDAIGAVLRSTPGSVLRIHQYSRDLDNPQSPTRKRYVEQLAGRGIAPARLRFAGLRSSTRHLEEIAKVDIALDSFPYNGTTTTHDCLWMGVPVITLAGDTHAGRVGFASLARLGLERLVAHDGESYVEKAVSLASCKSELVALRTGLRPLMIASGITSGARIMRDIEKAYRDIWTEYCFEQRMSASNA